jgi:hypothetical protein
MLPGRHTVFPRPAAARASGASHADTGGKSRTYHLLASLAVTAMLFAFDLAIFEPFWESNDDIGMSMIAHGYGIAATPSAGLIFVNVLIGGLLQILPAINGVLAYSWLLVAIVFLACWALLYFVLRSGGPFVLAAIALAIATIQLVAAPQFSIAAGVATSAGVVAWLSHTRSPSIGALVAGALLLSAGYLVRMHEAIFILVIALPFVPWSKLRVGVPEILTAGLTIGFVLIATVADHLYYQGPAWEAFNAFEPVRVPLTDYGLASQIHKHPALMDAHGFSKNDIQLIAHWFFFDPALAAPGRLSALFADLPARNALIDNAPMAWQAVTALFRPAMAPLTIAAIALTVFSRARKRAIMAWAIFVIIIAGFGWAGRPAVLHVYIPVPILIMFVCLERGLVAQATQPMWRVFPVMMLLVALLAMLRVYVAHNIELQARSELARADMAKLDPNAHYVVWGAGFPAEVAWPALAPLDEAARFRHYGLGWESLAPFALETFKGTPWRDLTDRFARDDDIPIITHRANLPVLTTYCREHHNGTLAVREEPFQTFTVFHVTCGAQAGKP